MEGSGGGAVGPCHEVHCEKCGAQHYEYEKCPTCQKERRLNVFALIACVIVAAIAIGYAGGLTVETLFATP